MRRTIRSRPSPFAPSILLVCFLLGGCSLSPRPDTSQAENQSSRLFEESVYPVLKKHCLACHGPFYQLADLSLETPEGIRKGGKNGSVIEPGKPQASELFRRISLAEEDTNRMPQKAKKLAPEQIEAIRSWIEAGAEFPESE